MNRRDFDSLDINEQINYINTRLLRGITLTNTCKEIGIGRSTIRDRFMNRGYEYNNKIKQYESIIEIVKGSEGVVVGKNKISSNDVVINQVVEEKQSSNDVVEVDLVNSNILKEMFMNYNDINNKLNEVYEWYQSSNNDVIIEEHKFIINSFEGELVSRSFKLYKSIQEEFAEFCKINSKYKVQDILCQLIREGLDKYKQ